MTPLRFWGGAASQILALGQPPDLLPRPMAATSEAGGGLRPSSEHKPAIAVCRRPFPGQAAGAAYKQVSLARAFRKPLTAVRVARPAVRLCGSDSPAPTWYGCREPSRP
jgi:hypothetical protein